MRLPQSLAAWGLDAFESVFKAELAALPSDAIPLQKAANWAVDYAAPVQVSVLGVAADGATITARVGVFFSETIAGCACGDAPMPCPTYADFQVTLDRTTALATITLL